MESLAYAEAAARDVAAVYAEAQAAIYELSDLNVQYGLGIDVPAKPGPDPAEAKVAGLLGLLVRNVAYDLVLDDQVVKELNAARKAGQKAA